MKRRRWAFALAGVCGAVLLGLATVGWNHHLRNFHTVEPHVLYRSGQLSPAGLKLVIRHYRIKTVVTLRTVRDPHKPYLDAWEAGVCAANGARHVRILPRVWLENDKGELPAEQMVREFLALMDNPTNHPVLVHCFAGVHRTGTLCAVFREEYQGWDSDRAIDEMEEYGFEPGQSRVAIENYLKHYQSKH